MTAKGEIRGDPQYGAALVEFAVLAPLLLLLVLGIVEYGWAFAQFNDVRHGTREGARFAAVDAGSVDDIRDRVCDSMGGLSAGMSLIQIDIVDGGAAEGDIASIMVTASVGSLTGIPFVSAGLPSSLSSDVQFRLEDDLVNWSAPTTVTRTC